MMEVPIAAPEVGPAARDRIETLLDDGALADGPEVRAFERAFGAYCGTDHAVATSNGTTALHAALEAFDVGSGDAVITPSFSFVASANAVALAGGRPVFVDVDPKTYTLDPEAVATRCEARDDVVGVMPVHLYGCPAPMDDLQAIADANDCFVLEDACQAHGASIGDERVGSLGDAACFSFYPTKNMTTGEGGVVTTDDEGLSNRIRRYINHGRHASATGGYEHVEVGHNHRMTSIAAAIGRSQLERLPSMLEARRENAAYYDDHLASTPVERPRTPSGYRHAYHQYTIRAPDRDELRASLAANDIQTGIYYPTPIHRQPVYAGTSVGDVSLPITDRAASEVLSLPVHPALNRDQLGHVVETIVDHYTDASTEADSS